MMNSMTGFGRAEGVDHGVALRFEISSVNRKQFDAKFSLPKELAITIAPDRIERIPAARFFLTG